MLCCSALSIHGAHPLWSSVFAILAVGLLPVLTPAISPSFSSNGRLPMIHPSSGSGTTALMTAGCNCTTGWQVLVARGEEQGQVLALPPVLHVGELGLLLPVEVSRAMSIKSASLLRELHLTSIPFPSSLLSPSSLLLVRSTLLPCQPLSSPLPHPSPRGISAG